MLGSRITQRCLLEPLTPSSWAGHKWTGLGGCRQALEHRPSPLLPVAPTSKNLVLHCEDHGGINATDDPLGLMLRRDCDLLGGVVALQGTQPKATWQEKQSRARLMATHNLSTAP